MDGDYSRFVSFMTKKHFFSSDTDGTTPLKSLRHWVHGVTYRYFYAFLRCFEHTWVTVCFELIVSPVSILIICELCNVDRSSFPLNENRLTFPVARTLWSFFLITPHFTCDKYIVIYVLSDAPENTSCVNNYLLLTVMNYLCYSKTCGVCPICLFGKYFYTFKWWFQH